MANVMKTSSRCLALVVVIGVSLLDFYPSAASAATVTVTVGNSCFCFSPATVTIHPGDTVRWTWSSSGHSSTSGSPGSPNGIWDSGIINQGAVFTHTFNSVGSFPYYCTVHGGCCGMLGTVTVANPMATPTPTPTPTATPAPTATPTPVVTTNAATNVASFSATLNGSLNPRGTTTTVSFQYGLTTSYGSTTPAQTQTGNTSRPISANITGLMASRVYHFRIVAHNNGGTSFGSDRTFTTLSVTGPPVVITSPATFIASFSATLNGLLDPHGLTTSVHFQYGTTTSYGLTTAPQSHSGNTYLGISANISSLTASTTYHFRVVASNSAGTRMGSDKTFTTLTATGPPVVTTNSATNITTSSATLNGSLDPHGLSTTVSYQWGTTTSYGHTTTMQTQSGNTYRNITANISGLTTDTTYHFRIMATNSAGTSVGGDRTFATQ
jgi:plastocyanin